MAFPCVLSRQGYPVRGDFQTFRSPRCDVFLTLVRIEVDTKGFLAPFPIERYLLAVLDMVETMVGTKFQKKGCR